MLSALKNTQAIHTKKSVYRWAAHVGSFLIAGVNFSNINNTKYNRPHRMNVQLAPCQSPVKLHTHKIFRICLCLATLFPPSGIYT